MSNKTYSFLIVALVLSFGFGIYIGTKSYFTAEVATTLDQEATQTTVPSGSTEGSGTNGTGVTACEAVPVEEGGTTNSTDCSTNGGGTTGGGTTGSGSTGSSSPNTGGSTGGSTGSSTGSTDSSTSNGSTSGSTPTSDSGNSSSDTPISSGTTEDDLGIATSEDSSNKTPVGSVEALSAGFGPLFSSTSGVIFWIVLIPILILDLLILMLLWDTRRRVKSLEHKMDTDKTSPKTETAAIQEETVIENPVAPSPVAEPEFIQPAQPVVPAIPTPISMPSEATQPVPVVTPSEEPIQPIATTGSLVPPQIDNLPPSNTPTV